jgi:hypothetical protein
MSCILLMLTLRVHLRASHASLFWASCNTRLGSSLLSVAVFSLTAVADVYSVESSAYIDTWTHWSQHGPSFLWNTGGWWHLNWGERTRSTDWSRINGMVTNTSNTWFPLPFHLLLSGHYYELFCGESAT